MNYTFFGLTNDGRETKLYTLENDFYKLTYTRIGK